MGCHAFLQGISTQGSNHLMFSSFFQFKNLIKIKNLHYLFIHAFELWCWEKILESPLYCKEIKPVNPKGNQSWIFIGRTDAEAEAAVFGHLIRRTDAFEKTLMLGKIGGRRRRGRQRVGWLDGITNSMDILWVSLGSWWWTGKPGMLQSMGLQRVGQDWVTELKLYYQTFILFLA